MDRRRCCRTESLREAAQVHTDTVRKSCQYGRSQSFPESDFQKKKRTKQYVTFSRVQRANWGIFVGSLIGAPVAATCSYILHLLIKHKKIQVISKTIGSAFKKVQEKVNETVDTVQTAVLGPDPDAVTHS